MIDPPRNVNIEPTSRHSAPFFWLLPGQGMVLLNQGFQAVGLNMGINLGR